MIVDLKVQTLPALVERSFSLYGNLPAIASVGETPITYAELRERVKDLSVRMRELGVTMGHRVALLGENCPNWVVAYLAVTSMGGIVVPILPGFPDQDVRHIIRNSECIAVFASERLRRKIEAAELPGVEIFLVLDDLSAERPSGRPDGLAEKTKHLLGIVNGRARQPHAATGPLPQLSEDDLAAIIYTSGTTGHSKGVMLTHRNIVSDTVGSVERFPIDSTDRFLSILPLSHAYEATGGMLCPLAVGASIFYMKGLPAPTKLIAAMQTVKPTAVLTVPLIMDAIYRKRVLASIKAGRLGWLYSFGPLRKIINRAAGKKLIAALGGKLRFFMLGGASLNEDLETFLRDAGIGYSTGYGMTEASPILTINPFQDVRVGSCGKPLPGVDIRIHDPDPATGVGEILVRGPNMMKGYYRNEEATAGVFVEAGWLRTGDLGLLDREGYLYIKGRSKNVIVGPSGENIYPEIIEHQLIKNPYVSQAIVYLRDGRLVARLYLDQDMLDQEFGHLKLSEPDLRKAVLKLLETIRAETNRQLPAFSAIQDVAEQPEPFELTPTNKVKRYLYTT
jgi:long-chain acyl-CoA synthetase